MPSLRQEDRVSMVERLQKRCQYGIVRAKIYGMLLATRAALVIAPRPSAEGKNLGGATVNRVKQKPVLHGLSIVYVGRERLAWHPGRWREIVSACWLLT